MRTFEDERARIRVLAHISRAQMSIDSLLVMAIERGKPDDAEALFQRVQAQHVGTPYADWVNDPEDKR